MNKLTRQRLEIGETAAMIAAEARFVPFATEAIIRARRDIEEQIRRDQMFLTTLEPYSAGPTASRVIRRMCEASEAADVGPMAAVAGAVAQEALEAMVREGCSHGWVDNGGDVALTLGEPITMEVFSDTESMNALAFELEPTNGIIGICSSSGKLGHSVSFGNADIVVAIAEDAYFADALATAVANRVGAPTSLMTCFQPFKGLEGFIGGFALIEGAVAMAGKLPRIVEVEHNPERMTIHSAMAHDRYTGGVRKRIEARA